MNVMYWGTFDPAVGRNRVLMAGLEAAGVELTVINRVVWDGLHAGGRRGAVQRGTALAWRYLVSWVQLVRDFWRAPRPDAVVVGYLGFFDVFVLWPMARLRGVPFYWDVFISLYNTVVEDRQLLREGSLLARLLYAAEWVALRLPDRVFIDTVVHSAYLVSRFGLSSDRVFSVPVGADTKIFRPGGRRIEAHGNLEVLFYGSFIPLHGVETLVAAMRQLESAPIHFTIVGRGQTDGVLREFVDSAAPGVVTWHEWLDREVLCTLVQRADLCLGIFGSTDKARRVIPNKVYEVLACGKPLLTMDSPAIRELLTPTMPGVWLVPEGDPQALADAILARLELRDGSERVYHGDLAKQITPPAVADQLLENLR